MRRIAIFVSIATIGLMLAFSIGGGVDALGGGEGNHDNTASSFIKNDKDKDKDKDKENGGGNGGGNGDGNGNAADQSNGNAGGNGGNGDGYGNDNENAGGNGNGADHGNGNGGGNAGVDSTVDQPTDAGNGDQDGGQSEDVGQSPENKKDQQDKKDKKDGKSEKAGDDGDDADNSEKEQQASKIRVCHQTGRDDYPYNLIEVSVNALPAHEGHGDFVAPENADASNDCEDEETMGTPVASSEASQSEGSPEASPVPSEKDRVCHATSSEENPFILIEVSVNALSAHERHGDFVAPDDADASNDCEDAASATPVASPEAEPIG